MEHKARESEGERLDGESDLEATGQLELLGACEDDDRVSCVVNLSPLRTHLQAVGWSARWLTPVKYSMLSLRRSGHLFAVRVTSLPLILLPPHSSSSTVGTHFGFIASAEETNRLSFAALLSSTFRQSIACAGGVHALQTRAAAQSARLRADDSESERRGTASKARWEKISRRFSLGRDWIGMAVTWSEEEGRRMTRSRR